jgi:hypothetical protein
MPDQIVESMPSLLDFVEVNFLEPRDVRKFSGFMPWGRHHMMGLRILGSGGRPNIMYGLGSKGPKKLDIVNPGEKMGFLPAELPHHLTYDYGWWHINTTDEIYIPAILKDGTIAFVIIEAITPDRYDRFAWYCQTCYSLLFIKDVNTGRVGIDGYWKAERDTIAEFNRDEERRRCRNCGTIHPHGYSFFSPESEKTW